MNNHVILGVGMRIMPRARHWKNSMNNHVILKGVDVEVIKVIQLASEVHNEKVNGNAIQVHKSAWERGYSGCFMTDQRC